MIIVHSWKGRFLGGTSRVPGGRSAIKGVNPIHPIHKPFSLNLSCMYTYVCAFVHV